MYAGINVLVFLVLSLYALRVLFSKASYVKLSKDEYVLLTAPEKFLLLTMLTGVIACYGAGLSSLRLMWWIILVILAFVIYRRKITFNPMVLIVSIFLGYILTTILWADDQAFGFRVFLKYLYPFLIMLFAMNFVTSKNFIFVALKYLVIVSFILSIFLGGFGTHFIGFEYIFYLGGVFWVIATMADYFAVISAICFVLWWKTGEKKYLFLIVWFLLSCIFQSIRTGLLSIGLMFIIGCYLRYRITSIPFIVGIVFLGLSAILFVPQVKEKMFFDTSKVQTFADITQSYSDGNINSSARFTMWEVLLEKFYKDNEALGSGLGSVQRYMYNNYVFGGLEAPHNDFVQMLCDIGYIGVFLYLMIPILFMILHWRYFKNVKYSDLNMIASIAFLSYIALIPAMNFDNVVNYALPVHSYPFIFIGLFYAYKRIIKEEESKKDV